MTEQLLGNSMWQLIKQSDAMSKGVMLVLLVMSIVCWTIFLYKFCVLRMRQRSMEKALADIKKVESFDQLLTIASVHADTVAGVFLAKNLTYLKHLLESNRKKNIAGITADQWTLVEQHMNMTVDDLVIHEESNMAVLSASVAISPLLGLFGTVWGLVHAFIRITEKQSADIATVAPGIAEALMTTLAGLMVAIPALAMFVYLQGRIRAFEKQSLQFADRYSAILQKLFVW